MKIERETQSFGNLKPNDCFRPVIGDNPYPCQLAVGDLHMAVADGDYMKGYNLENPGIVSIKRTAPVLRVRTKLLICQENH
jgi:hypothetical protein